MLEKITKLQTIAQATLAEQYSILYNKIFNLYNKYCRPKNNISTIWLPHSERYQHIFTSQQGQDYYPDEGCGVAAFFMLLKYIHFTPMPTWKTLCEELNMAILPTKDCPDTGISPEDVFKYVIKNNIPFRMQFFDHEWEKCLTYAPILVFLECVEEWPDDAPHCIVLTSFNGQYFSYLDPWYEEKHEYIRHISLKRFKQYYMGIACQLFKTSAVIEIPLKCSTN